jgi:hypothetical protein
MIVEPPPGSYDLRLSARWDAESQTLHIKGGEAPPFARVTLTDGAGALLAEVMAGEDGEFRARIRPLGVPCSVRAQTGEYASRVVAVSAAPANCGTPQLYVRLLEAKWNEDLKRLRVQGDRAPSFATVDVYDAGTGARLGSVMADATGKFDYRGTMEQAACSVRVGVGGLQTAAIRVRDARRYCGN